MQVHLKDGKVSPKLLLADAEILTSALAMVNVSVGVFPERAEAMTAAAAELNWLLTEGTTEEQRKKLDRLNNPPGVPTPAKSGT